jgi:hypothetical protein
MCHAHRCLAHTLRLLRAHSFPTLKYTTLDKLGYHVRVPVEKHRPVLLAAQDVCARMSGWPIRELVIVEVLAMLGWHLDLSKHELVEVIVDR